MSIERALPYLKRVRQAGPAAIVVLTFAILTILLTWPAVTQLDSHLAQNLHWSRDAYQQAYEMWWFKKALVDLHTSPGTLRWIYFPTGGYYPLLLTYFTTYAVGVPFLFFLSPVATYNVVFLLTFFLSGLSGYALCAYLTRNRWAGLLGGIIYAFYPNRMAHALAGHLELISTYLFPLYLLLLIKTARRPRPARTILCGLTLAASCLVQPLFIPYLLVPFTATWLLYERFILRERFERRAWWMLLGAFGLAALIVTPFYWPVLREQASGQGAYLEDIGAVRFAADLLGVVAPSSANPVLKALGLVPAYAERVAPSDWRIAELLTYAGIVPLTLAPLAVWSQRRRVGAWALVALLAAVLSLGPLLKVNGQVVTFSADGVQSGVALPYALLLKVPLLALNRAPARINATLMLALAVLAAYGLAWLLTHIRRGWKHITAGALCLVVLIEFLVIWPLPTLPVETPAFMAAMARSPNEGAVLNLPVGAGYVKQAAIFYQTVHERPVFDSWFQRALPVFPDVAEFLDGLLLPSTQADIVPAPAPGDRAAVARAEGTGYVFLYTPYVDNAAARMRMLESEFGSLRSTEGGIVIYEVAPGRETPDNLVYALPNNDWRSPERGWHDAEEWNGRPARWMTGEAALFIYAPRRQEGALQFGALPLAAPQRLQIEVNREPVATLVIGEWITYTTPAFTLQPGLNQITLRALDGCSRYVGDPRCAGVTLATAGERAGCSPYITAERCLSVLFQDVRFVSVTVQPVEAILGEQVRLVGYDLAGTPAPGQTLTLTLYWQALRPVVEDYTIFVHLLGSDGALLAQHDAPPLDGLYPTSRWVAGDVFTQRVSLTIPPEARAGKYELLAGMYTYPDLVRLPVVSERPYARDGLVWLQRVEISNDSSRHYEPGTLSPSAPLPPDAPA